MSVFDLYQRQRNRRDQTAEPRRRGRTPMIVREDLERTPRTPTAAERAAANARADAPRQAAVSDSTRRVQQQGGGMFRISPAAARTRYLAEGAAAAENQARSAGGRPASSTLEVTGTQMGERRSPIIQNSRTGPIAVYRERATSQAEIVAQASRTTGAPQEFISALVGHESGGKADARAPTSSATGHAQFIDDTWLGMIHRYGERYGAGDLAAQITRQRNGVYKVNNAEARRQILDLRNDPGWAAIMAGHYGQENAALLRGALGRNRLTEGEVYLAHFLGPDAAARVIRHGTRPGDQTPAINLVRREAAAANGRVFYVGGNYDRDGRYLGGGRPRTAREVYNLQTRNFRNVMWPEAASQ